MKYVALVVLMALVMCGVAYAEQTGTTLWHKHSYVDNDSYVDRYNEYQKKLGMPLGVGVDAILYEFDENVNKYGLDSVNVEAKYDCINNDNAFSGGTSVFFVVHVNLYQAGKKLLGK